MEDIVTEGDKLVLRWLLEGTHTGDFMGVAPTGASVNLRITEIFLIANGQLVEAWDQYDALGLMRQIGAVPGPGETPAE